LTCTKLIAAEAAGGMTSAAAMARKAINRTNRILCARLSCAVIFSPSEATGLPGSRFPVSGPTQSCAKLPNAAAQGDGRQRKNGDASLGAS